MFIALSRFKVANGMTAQVHEAFERRPHHVDHASGFLRMDVMRPVDEPDEFWLLTYWENESSYRIWHKGHSYSDSHQGIPKGLKLVRGRTHVQFFDHVCS